MAPACVDAGITTKEECRALLLKQKNGGQGNDNGAAEKAAADKAAADKAAAEQQAQQKAAADKAAADKAAADKAAADNAAAQKQAEEKAAREKEAADKAAAAKQAKEKAATPQQEQPAVQPAPTEGNNQPPRNGRRKGPADQNAQTENAQPQAPASDAAAPVTDQPTKGKGRARLPQDCIAAGIKTLPDCDAFHAKQQPAAEQPTAPAAGQPAPAEQQPPVKGRRPAPGGNPEGQTPPVSTATPVEPTAGQPQQPPAAKPVQPTAEQPANQPKEVLPELPKGVSKDAVAPLLDSAKDEETGKAPPPSGQQPPPAPAANVPPPTDDKAAQAKIRPEKITPIDQAKGQAIEASASAPKVQVPQNVTIINQTVNNTTTVQNNTTNVQNNNGPGMQQNNGPGQPNGRPGRPGEIGPGGPNGGPNGGPGRPGGPNNGPGRPGGPGFDHGQPNPIGLGIQTILQIGNQLIVNSPGMDQRRIANRPDDHTNYERLPGNRYRETISRPNGVRVVTIYNQYGDILQRSRFDRNGRETVLAYFDPRYDEDLSNWRDPGDDLPPLRLNIPARDYVLDADQADESEIQDFFAEPPVEHVQRLYSIDEVKRSARIRDMVRRLEVGDLTFDTGAATISEDQVGNLSAIAKAMLALLQRNPAETFLIEGHTDAVGSDASNLVLSDERAATVAQILTDFYHIPPENLATQGYGERFLKVQTQGPEPLNRRVTIRRITPLVTVATQDN